MILYNEFGGGRGMIKQVIPNNKWWVYGMSSILLLVYQQVASKIGGEIASLFDYRLIDKENIFMWISVHHIVQMLIALLAISLFGKLFKLDFGFKIGDYKSGCKYILIFTLIMMGYIIINYILGYGVGAMNDYPYPLTLKNILGTLGFQMFLSGPSEEILFRALPITILVWGSGKYTEIKVYKYKITVEVLIAAILFAMAHITWSLVPASIGIDYFQLVYAFVLGYVYGKAFQKSKSVLYPMVMHSISNIAMVGMGYVFQWLM